MAGMMGNPLCYIRLLTNSDNLDDIGNGVYWTVNLDNPSNSPTDTYNNIIIQIRNNARGDKLQLLFSMNTHKLYFRAAAGGSSWFEWKAIATL